MAEFSAADAAFTGFRVVWQRPWAVGIWAGVQFVVALAVSLFTAVSAGPAVKQFFQLALKPSADPGPMLAVLSQLAPTSMVIVIVSLVLTAVFGAAMNRAVMRPQESRFGYLRLATDELRQLGLFTALLLAVYLAMIVVSVVLIVLIAGGGAIGGILGLAVGLPAAVCGFIFFGVRFSLASPMTFATGRINFVGSWRLTRGRFFPLLGTYFLAIALNLVVAALTFVIAVLGMAILAGGFGGMSSAAQTDVGSVAAMLAPGQLIYLAISSIGAALRLPVTMCPPAAIYRSLTGGPGAVSQVFE